MRGIDEAALEEGQLVVELEPVDMEGAFRRADPPQRVLWKQPLIGEVVDGQDRGQSCAAPGEVGRHQRGLPVIGVDEVGCPILVQPAHRKFGRGRREPAETDVVVRPVTALFVAIGVARPVIELRAQQHVDR